MKSSSFALPSPLVTRVLALVAVSTCLWALGCGPTGPEGPICDPLGDGSGPSGASGGNYGLKGSLYALPNTLEKSVGVAAAMAMGHKFDLDVYLSQLNVPTQQFERGFVAENGVALTQEDGSLFTSWFALHMESMITLGADQLPGQYQLALYSDDGSVLKIDDGTGFKVLVDNDKAHESVLRVATTPITLNVGDALPITLDYMQGSPNFLSVIMLWRPWPGNDDSRPVNDPAVGVMLPGRFWDWTQNPSTPKQDWIDLLARGWKVVAPENFVLTAPNPCTPAK